MWSQSRLRPHLLQRLAGEVDDEVLRVVADDVKQDVRVLEVVRVEEDFTTLKLLCTAWHA